METIRNRFSWAYGLAAAFAMVLLPASMATAEQGAVDEPNSFIYKGLEDANKKARITEDLIPRATLRQFELRGNNERRVLELEGTFQGRGLEDRRTRSIDRNTRRAENPYPRANVRGRRLRSEPEAFQR